MKKKSGLHTVRKVYGHREQQAEQQMQDGQKQLAHEEQQLEQLQQFRQQIFASNEQATSRNGHWFLLRQQFSQQLDRAIGQQEDILARQQQVCEQHRDAWLEQHKQRRVIDELLAKEAEAALRAERRKLQKLEDEWAEQRHARNQDTRS